MSIRSCLKTLNTIKKSHRLPSLHPPEPYRELPPAISKTLDPTAAALSDLSPSKLLKILSDPAVRPLDGYQFFNCVLDNQSSVSFVPDLQAHLTLVCRLLKAHRFTEAENLLKSLLIGQNKRYPFPLLASTVENSGSFEPKVTAKLFNVMLNLYSENEKFEQVMEVFDYMVGNGVEVDERTCTLHLLVLKRNHEMKLVLEFFFHRMVKSGMKISPFSLAVVVGGLCENGEIRRCREFVEEMIEYGIKSNVVTFHIMLNACLKRWNFSQLELVLSLMEKQAIPCDETTYKILIEGYAGCGKLEEAERMVLEMHDRGFGGQVHLWNLVITRYCRRGLVDRAANLFDKMSPRGVSPSADTYSALIDALCGKEKVEAVLVYVSKMVKSGIELEEVMVNRLIDGVCRKGMEYDEVCDLLVG